MSRPRSLVDTLPARVFPRHCCAPLIGNIYTLPTHRHEIAPVTRRSQRSEFRRSERLDRTQAKPERSTLRSIRASRRALAMLAVPIAVVMSLTYTMPNAQAVEPALVEIPAELQTISALAVATDASITPIERGSYGVTAAPPPIVWPVPAGSRRADGFGARGGAHEGADMNPPSGSPIVAIAAGVVLETNAPGSSALGTHVRIQHLVDGKVVVSVYGNMIQGSMPLKEGDRVTAGQFIGSVGNTGRSTGTHLHLEIRLGGTTPVDPIAWLIARVR